MEPCLQELKEIQRFKERVMNEPPPHPHHRRASWRYRRCTRAQVLGGERERERERVENSDGIEDRSRRGHVSTRTRLPLLPQIEACSLFLSILSPFILSCRFPYFLSHFCMFFCQCAAFLLINQSLYIHCLSLLFTSPATSSLSVAPTLRPSEFHS